MNDEMKAELEQLAEPNPISHDSGDDIQDAWREGLDEGETNLACWLLKKYGDKK